MDRVELGKVTGSLRRPKRESIQNDRYPSCAGLPNKQLAALQAHFAANFYEWTITPLTNGSYYPLVARYEVDRKSSTVCQIPDHGTITTYGRRI